MKNCYPTTHTHIYIHIYTYIYIYICVCVYMVEQQFFIWFLCLMAYQPL